MYLKVIQTDFSLMFKETLSWFNPIGPNLCPGQIFPSSHSSEMLLDMTAVTRTFDMGELPQFHNCKTVFWSHHFTMKRDRNILWNQTGDCVCLPPTLKTYSPASASVAYEKQPLERARV
ncbi:hypothetical protein I79_014420 [Cricetulus griseus]|uniref:Uncharacterized protein n=1 Tax=Cricetulus griseus TaxID=10029 RepID=G3HU01_CRIGR|nr:hypothetical protein I79_014420 [Cricetulus griseus]